MEGKVADHGLTGKDPAQGLEKAIVTLRSDAAKRGFASEMRRFVSTGMAKRLQRHPELGEQWISRVVALARAVSGDIG